MRRKWSLQQVLKELRHISKHAGEEEVRERAATAAGRLQRDIELLEEELAEAKMIGARGPAFDGDFVGWLDDDFDEVEFTEISISGWMGILKHRFEKKARTSLNGAEQARYAEMADRFNRLRMAFEGLEAEGRYFSGNDNEDNKDDKDNKDNEDDDK